MSKIGLFKKEWIDMVFEGRNKQYGAYKLRSESPVTTSIALAIGVVLFTGAVLSYHLPALIGGMLNKEEEKKEDVKLVEIADLPPPPEEILPPEPPKVEQVQAPKSIVEEIKFKPLEAAKKEEVPEEIPDTKDFKDATPSDKSAEASPDGEVNIDKPSGDLKKGVEVEDTGIYNSAGLQVQPEYPGGIDAFYKYVNSNFRIPEIDQNMTARIHVSFVVEKDGSMSAIKVVRDPGYGLGKEAERVLKSMKKKWSPGIQNGKPVRASYNLPITINIKS